MLVSLKAGKCNRDNNIIIPDPQKGLIYLQVEEDSLLHFYWKEQDKETPEEDLILFPFDVEFKKINTGTFLLKFLSSTQRLFFWSQELDQSKNDEIVEKINFYINNPPVQEEQPIESDAMEVDAPNPQISDQLKDILMNLQVPENGQVEKDVKLSKVLTFEKCKPLFEDNKVVEELMQFLPSDVDKSVQEIKETIRSPQLQVAIRSFVHALRSRQIQPLLMQFGFNEEECMSVYNVESFLKVLKKNR